MSGELDISKESAQLITGGLRSAINELKEAGGSATGSLQGAGMEELVMSKMEAGGGGLADTFENFCERWEWGVRALVQDANQIAARLGLAAGMLHAEDQYWQGTFKIVANAAVGNPHATEEEVTSQSWGEVLTPDAPDYSAESFRRAGEESLQTWKDTGRSLLTEGHGGMRTDLMNDALGIDDQDFDRAMDDVLGPSPEERAQTGRTGQPGDGGEG